jgi:hypothetical protein
MKKKKINLNIVYEIHCCIGFYMSQHLAPPPPHPGEKPPFSPLCPP